MKSEFLLAITQLAAERNLPKEVVFKAVAAALASAYRKEEFGAQGNLTIKIDHTSGEVRVYAQKTVVEAVTDPYTELSLAEAQRSKSDASIGETIAVEATPPNTGRIAAQTAKQVVMQRLREAERDFILGEFVAREGELVSGVVQRIEPRQVTIDLGKVEGILPFQEQVRTEHYRVGQRLRLYLLEVSRSNRGPRLLLSRSHPNLVRCLFEMEVPEVRNGVVELKAIAREPGSRTKIAVAAHQDEVDPVGSCIGLRGIRIQNIVNELQGEKIDIVQWHPESKAFIANALAPARVLSVEADDEEKCATVVVPDGQLSLAIGKEGQNARLVARLTGWKIDIKSATAAEAERAAKEEITPIEVAEAITEELPQEVGQEQPQESPRIRFAEEIFTEASKAEVKAKEDKKKQLATEGGVTRKGKRRLYPSEVEDYGD
jgi:N utilization substance protein A